MGWSFNYFRLGPSDTRASLAVNHCKLASRVTGAGLSPGSVSIAHSGVLGRAPRGELACSLSRS